MSLTRPDPVLFAKASYYLGFATSGLLLLTLVLMFTRATTAAGLVLWLTLLTSAVGTFTAWAARRDFQTSPPSDAIRGMANLGWRINRLALILIVIMAVMSLLVVAIIRAMPTIIE